VFGRRPGRRLYRASAVGGPVEGTTRSRVPSGIIRAVTENKKAFTSILAISAVLRPRTLVLACLALGLVATAGCVGGPTPEVAERDCGNIGGIGGCAVTVENPGEDPMEVEVTVEALDEDDNVVASGTETILIDGNSQKEVTVGATNAGGDVDRYEVSVRRAS
jgi:hypothetical protein